MDKAFQYRRRALAGLLRESRIDSLLVTHPANWFYLTGFTGESGALVVSKKAATLVTDGRFVVQAKEETKGVRVRKQKGSVFESAAEALREAKARRVGFDPVHMTVSQLQSMRKASKGRLEWVSAPGMVEALRARKDAGELAQMRKAAILAGEIVEIAIGLLKPGASEREVGAEIEYQMRRRGASGPAFETIVAFGSRAALPHARPTGKRLRKNELVVLDLGVILGHYCSDITRTVFMGRAPKRIQTWYKAVLEAQGAAISAVKDGVSCGEVDAAARRVLESYGLDQLFVHSTGHGLGLEIHEDPRVAKGQARRLEPGNVITIEPGVYAEGIGGIRIEDDVAVHAGRNEVLTRAPRDLIEL
ncbi:MAG TPA: Xaa-Pro peptidase family protein [Candidatus Acidoferrum sp.]|nr:Xaa-Pro peptidase family protein [Candidatus Acidoferrum sp.]